MGNQISSNRTVAKNAMLLYIRMAISVFVSLYTSRVVLQILGFDDYGIYGVVGSVVSMLGFLNMAMSGATSRFLTYELGRNDQDRLTKTFSAAIFVHIVIALIVLLVSETLGLWFLMYKLVIPDNRMFAAHCVYQLSVITTVLSIIQVPYNACIIAHERMDVYAYVEILNVCFKLAIVFLLSLVNFDKLIFYAILIFTVSFLVFIIYVSYSYMNFSECHIEKKIDRSVLKPMFSFSMWDLYGNFSLNAKAQGRNFLINMFFGVALNAASSVAISVNSAISGFSNTVIQAFRPHIIKLYASNNISQMQVAAVNAINYSLLLFAIMAVPLIIEADYIFQLWLVNVPPFAVNFSILVLISSALSIGNNIIGTLIHASGRIKRISIVTGSIILLHLPIIYLVFKLGGDVIWAYSIDIIGFIFIIYSNLCIAKNNIPQLSKRYFILNMFIALSIIIVSGVITYLVIYNFSSSFLKLIICVVVNFSLILIISYFFLLDRNAKNFIKDKIGQIVKR